MCSLAATGPVISVASCIGSVRNVTPSPSASKVTAAAPFGVCGRQLLRVGREMELGPLRARDRPIVLMADDEFLARMTDVELHARLLVPAVLLALEEVAEELLLQVDAVVGVIVRPMLDAVHFEPFLFRRRAEEALEIAARVQRLAAPVRGRKQRHLDLRPVRQHRLVEIVVERMREIGLAEIVAVGAHLLVGERLRAGYPVAVHAAAMAFDAKPVLHGLDLHVVPVLREGVVDAAVVAELAIEIGKAFPDADGGEVLGLQARDLPLVDGVVGDAAQADLAVRPRLHARPFDAVDESPWSRAATSARRSRASGRSRANRRARQHSRPAPTSPDRRLPSSGTCWSSRPSRPDASAPCGPRRSCSRPRSAATCRKGRG